MTTRVKGLTVALTQDLRDDDVQALANAIKLLHGVASVTTLPVTSEDWVNRAQIRREYRVKLFAALGDPGPGPIQIDSTQGSP